ncbi:MAG: hypothetical protein JWO41_946 [Candidatus Saccharibacteria bacterium]|nr:hypothetical protein [Candidatus Saccharibacteria bacterium]
METLVYNLRPGETGHAPRIAVSLPETSFGKLRYDDSASLINKIRHSRNKTISYKRLDEGAEFVIDPLVIGRLGQVLGEHALKTAVTLLFLVDQAASARGELNPLVRLRPIPSKHNGEYRSNAVLAWGGAKPEQFEQASAVAQATMASMYSDIICRGEGNGTAQSMATANIYPVEGIYLGVGKPRELMRSQPFTEDQQEVYLAGRTSNLEHSIIHLGGILAIQQALELATA